ncbi:MAG: glycosyltransferase [Chloroflexota bacterium]
MKTILIISPPFYSHFSPLLNIAKALKDRRQVRVVVATAPAFENQVLSAGCDFTPLEVTSNANTGIAEKTRQLNTESKRLEQFFEATKKGAIPTLLVQAKHRRLDMLPDPLPIYRQLQRLYQQWQPSLFLVDQLNYAVTLSLYALDYPFITFCPGHPTYIPEGDQTFGVPYAFPCEIQPCKEDLCELKALASEIEREFTFVFNQFLEQYAPHRPTVENAFHLTSSRAVLFNYPDFGHLHLRRENPLKWFGGHCFSPNPPLDPEWQEIIRKNRSRFPKVLLSFGTFLSARSDVIQKILQNLREIFPNGLFFAAVGARIHEYADFHNSHFILREFLPQTGILPDVDLVIHHGGNNTFTETIYHAKPMLIFPFSSDQFAIAHDAELFGIGQVLNPNDFLLEEIEGKINSLLSGDYAFPLQNWSLFSQQRGASFLANSILSLT